MVTVLLALYRGERYLPQLTASLQGQTMGDFRVLWQDDGGDPHHFDDERFVPAAHQGMHLGAAGNFFDLLLQSPGDDTALCDQDDVWHADHLARSLQALREAESRFGADTPLLVHSDARLIDGAGKVLHPSFFRHQGWDAKATTLNRLLVQNNATGCTMVMNEALRRILCAHLPGEGVLHDWWIALTAAAYGQVICLPEALTDYRQHEKNAIGASRKGLLHRAMASLRAPQRVRERIELPRRMACAMLDIHGEELPQDARCTLEGYIALQKLPKAKRIAALRRGGYLMQHPLMRLAQYLLT